MEQNNNLFTSPDQTGFGRSTSNIGNSQFSANKENSQGNINSNMNSNEFTGRSLTNELFSQMSASQPFPNVGFSNSVASTPENVADNDDTTNVAIAKRRVSKACDHCRKRKIKCGPINPAKNKCDNCIKYSSACTFTHQPSNQKRQDNGGASQGTAASHINVAQPESLVSIAEAQKVGKPRKNAAGSPSMQNLRNSQYDNNLKSQKIANTLAGGQTNMLTTSMANSPNHNISNQVVSRVEKVDRKISMVIDNMARFEWVLGKLVKKYDDKKDNDSYTFKPLQKEYSTSLLSTQKLEWTKKILAPGMPNAEFLAPVREMLTLSLRWYLIQNKKMVDFSTPAVFAGEVHLYSLPTKEQARRLLENFHSSLLSAITCTISLKECLNPCDKYYDPNSEQLTYSELFLLNVLLCYSASVTQLRTFSDTQFVRKDKCDPNKHELKTIENNTLLNAMYYYHKLSMNASGIQTLQALLLLHNYLASNYSGEIAINVLSTAIRFAIDMNLNKSSHYRGLPLSQIARERSLWWECFTWDKTFSLMLSRAPLINESNMDILDDDGYFKYIETVILPKIYANNMDGRKKITNLKQALAVITNTSDNILFVISYYILKLSLIEAKIYEVGFSVRSTSETFDAILEKVLGIQKELNQWKDSLYGFMKLENYKQYLSMLFTQSHTDNPALSFETACFHVVNAHFRYFYSVIMLSVFTTSFLMDNKTLFAESFHDIPTIYNTFSTQYKTESIKMLTVFQSTIDRPYISPDLLYNLLTAVFVLIFHVINCLNDPQPNDIRALIKLLRDTHLHLVGENQERFPLDNMKFNTSIFFYTFFLEHITKVVEDADAFSAEYEPYTSQQYAALLDKIIEQSRRIKSDAFDGLMKNLKTCFNFKRLYGNVDIDGLLSSENLNMQEVRRSSISIFDDLSPHMLQFLKSDELIVTPATENHCYGISSSLLPETDSKEEIVYPANIRALHSNSIDIQVPQIKIASPQFSNLLPFGDLYYDREFSFMKIFKDEGN
ncbi:hypothetical protein KAFR_0C01320 [Kazachstania africana CBS 2517]|uniref:Zn(2)-C6 fungal-type domain-containing protein n=1 Tax=Kazachstania africana (strain ATCC 22294 / BCRC 22015 / CBS 2517 / CECT 1963 / NBRC 1671 / NRRL Y-8276) TaxID=1071382 RepID=H2ARX6_KAZAF|nr:hypothetical protein KAFR_0C01320 [Kazachstania africana CBS 2517]CCF57126.1 hypothetical protein KAFR_0C01320 [Kazachstania africana CBS 2517]